MSPRYELDDEADETAVTKAAKTRDWFAAQAITGVAVAMMVIAAAFGTWYLAR